MSQLHNKHDNRIRKELEKIQELPGTILCEEGDHHGGKLLTVTIQDDSLLQLHLNELTKENKIQFQILLGEEYPFIIPQICCLTPLNVSPRIHDRRNLIENLLERPWGPAILIKDVIEKIPHFLKLIEQYRHSQEYLHDLGTFTLSVPYYLGDLEKSYLTLFSCKANLRSLLGFNNQILLALSDTYLLVFESSTPKLEKTNLVLTEMERIKNVSVVEKGDKCQAELGDGRTVTLSFESLIKSKEFSLLFTHAKSAAMVPQEPKGRFTGQTLSQLLSRVQQMSGQLQRIGTREVFDKMKNVLSDIVEMQSVLDLEETAKYTRQLTQLFRKEDSLPKE